MTTGRMEAFSDGVLAIIITIMGLELTVPHGADPAALRPLLPKISLAIYAVALPLAFVNRWIAVGLYVLVAVIRFLPDRRIEKRLGAAGESNR